jgi:acetyltransferase-like isoleucine patch superfamily enzyme
MVTLLITFVGALLRRASHISRRLASKVRRAVILAMYPNCFLGHGTSIAGGVTVKATDGGLVEIGRNVNLATGATVVAKGGTVRIADNTFIGAGSLIIARGKIEIGSDCLIAERVSIRDQNHKISRSVVPFSRQGFSVGPIQIGNNVWIGAGAVVLQNVTIANNSVAAANAVVTRDIQEWTLAAGIPARAIKTIQIETTEIDSPFPVRQSA